MRLFSANHNIWYFLAFSKPHNTWHFIIILISNDGIIPIKLNNLDSRMQSDLSQMLRCMILKCQMLCYLPILIYIDHLVA